LHVGYPVELRIKKFATGSDFIPGKKNLPMLFGLVQYNTRREVFTLLNH
jgi:hypothetical protein